MAQNEQEKNEDTLKAKRDGELKKISNSIKSFAFALICIVWWRSGLTDKTDILFSLLVVIWIKLQYIEGGQ